MLLVPASRTVRLPGKWLSRYVEVSRVVTAGERAGDHAASPAYLDTALGDDADEPAFARRAGDTTVAMKGRLPLSIVVPIDDIGVREIEAEDALERVYRLLVTVALIVLTASSIVLLPDDHDAAMPVVPVVNIEYSMVEVRLLPLDDETHSSNLRLRRFGPMGLRVLAPGALILGFLASNLLASTWVLQRE